MNIIPKSFQHLSRKEKITTVLLGGAAVGSVMLLLDHFASETPRAYANRYAVRGTWTDMAGKLGITIGADLDIKTAQRYLNQIQNAGLAENGVLDTATSRAIRKFQDGNGIEQSGVIDEETGNALQYFAAATSKSPALQKAVTLTTPAASAPAPWANAVAADGRMGPPFTDALPMSVKGAQRALNDLMHFALPLTGIIDQAAQGALATFQAQNGLPATGQLDAETSNALLYLATAAKAAAVPPRHRAPATARAQAAAPPPLTAAQKQMLATAPPGAGLDLGQGWIAFALPGGGTSACRNDDFACIQQSSGAQGHAAAWGPVVGLQSTTMYDPRSYYGDPKPYWPATNVDYSMEP